VPRANCANCGARLPKGGRFCPECGVRTSVANEVTAVEEIPPEETGSVPVHKVAASPRYFGIAPPLALFALAVASLVAAIIVFVAGNAIAGALLLAAAVLFSALFVAASRRLPENAVARVGRHLVESIRARTGFAVEAVSVHSSARIELFRLRRELADLVAERAEAARVLGEAVYRGAEAEAEVEAGRNRMSELEQALAEKERQMTTVTAAANERIQRAQLQVQPTEVVEPPQVPEPMPAPSEPPRPITVPEPSPVPSEPPMPVPSPEPGPEPSPPQPEQPS